MENTNTWKNLGDVNFLQYGGCLVRKSYTEEHDKEYPTLANYYEVISLIPDSNNEDFVLAGICSIDLEDYVETDSIFDYAGYPELAGKKLQEIIKEIGAEAFAAYIVSYYGVGNLCGESPKSRYPMEKTDWMVTRKEAEEWLKEYGWSEEKC